jgi:hypothetical protein
MSVGVGEDRPSFFTGMKTSVLISTLCYNLNKFK